jgi:ribonuclease D
MIHVFENDLPDDLDLKGDLAIDTETMGLNIYRDRLCLIQINNSTQDSYLIKFDGKNYNAPNLKKILNNPATLKIFHYARFDIAVIFYYLSVKITNIFCTKIASKIVRTYTEYHGLKDLCRELLGINISKQQQSSYWGRLSLSKDQEEYAAGDVIYLHQLKNILYDMLKSEERLDLAQKLFDFIPTRVELDIRGWSEIDIFAH